MDKSVNFSGWLLVAVLLVGGCQNKTAPEHIEAAKRSLADGQPQVAMIELKNAIQKAPESGEARSLLGQLYLQSGDLLSALKELDRATELGRDDDGTQIALFKTQIAIGRHAEVIGALEERPDLSPPFAVLLADAYLVAGDPERARPLYEQGLHTSEGLLGMARLAESENDLDSAKAYVTKAVTLDPALRDGWMLKARLELVQNQPDEALASFENVRRLPGGQIAGEVGLVRSHLLAGRLDAAQADVGSLLTRLPEYAPAHYLQALISYRRGDLDSAESALRTVQQYDRDHLPTLYLMGAVKAQQRQFGQAEASLRRYLALEDSNVSVRKLLALVYNAQQKPQAVVEILQNAAQVHADPQLWAMLGSAMLRTGKAAEATQAFQKAVELAPDMAPFRNQLALSLLSAGDDEAAVAELSSALEIDEDQFQSDYLLAMVRLRKDDFEGANEAIDALITKSADSPIGYNLKGVLLLRQGHEAAASAQFQTALDKAPGYLPAAHNLAGIAEKNGDEQRARMLYDAVLQAEPDNQEATLAKIDLLLRGGELEEGLALLRDAVTRYPQSAPAQTRLLRLLLATGRLSDAESAAESALQQVGEVPEILLLKGDIELRSGDQSEAQKLATRLQTLVGQFAGDKTLLAALGNLQLRLGNLTLARSNLELAVERPSPPPRALVDLARLDLAENNPQAAQVRVAQLKASGVSGEEISLVEADTLLALQKIDAARDVLQTMADEDSRPATIRLALIAARQRDFDGAQARYAAWLKAHPDDSGVKNLLADLHVQKGDRQAARRQYESMLPTDNPIVLNNLAWIYLETGDERALEMARLADQAAPKNPDIEDTLGWVLVENGAAGEGLSYLRASARARPQNATIQYHLGVAYQRVGDSEGARGALKKALALGDFPERGDAQRRLSEI